MFKINSREKKWQGILLTGLLYTFSVLGLGLTSFFLWGGATFFCVGSYLGLGMGFLLQWFFRKNGAKFNS